MRLRTFVAPTMAEIMREVRTVLGEDAIIVSTLTAENGLVRVTAALEQEDIPFDDAEPAEERGPQGSPDPAPGDAPEILSQALHYHGVPPDLATRIVDLAACIDVDDPSIRLAGALETLCRFRPHREHSRPVMMIGPPGAGKSLTAAKLAARTALSGKRVSVIAVDAGCGAPSRPLADFSRVMGIEFETADAPAALRSALEAADGRRVFVDSGGINPFDYGEIARLVEFAEAGEVESTLVMPAGMDSIEAADIAEAFGVLRPARIVTTRVDMARRLGAMVTVAGAGRLALGEAGIAPQIANGLAALDAMALARLLMREPAGLDLAFLTSEATQ